MTSIPLAEVKDRIAEVLERQDSDAPILLTKGTEAVGLLVKVPERLRHRGFDVVTWLDAPEGHALVMIESESRPGSDPEAKWARPVFGSCRGMLTVVAEDDEHLKDFAEYME
jgi:hypothetical protein